MILDSQALFSDAQAITGSAVSDNIVDLFVEGGLNTSKRDVGRGAPLRLLVQSVADFNTLTSMTVEVETSVDEAFSAPVTLASGTLALADLVAGGQFPINFMPYNNYRYVRLNYTVVGGSPTTGAVTAGIVSDVQSYNL